MRSVLKTTTALLLLLLAACGSPTRPASDRAPSAESGGLPPTTEMPPTMAPVPEAAMRADATAFARMTPVPQPTVVVAGVADAPAVMQVTAALRDRGRTPALSGESRVEFLADAPGQAYRLGDGWLHLHLYPSAEAAEAKTADIQRGFENPVASLPGPPHAFRCDTVIVLYLGTDEQVTEVLTELCGPQIAGRN